MHEEVHEVAPLERSFISTGPTDPQAGVRTLGSGLPVRQEPGVPGAVWVVGAHGGAGESRIAALADNWVASDHTWPGPLHEGSVPALLVARTHMDGLKAARVCATQWAAGVVPHVRLLGLVLVADAPGRMPRVLRDFAGVVEGGVPRVWRAPWVESWRLGEATSLETAPRALRFMVDEVYELSQVSATEAREER
ncbi:Uncharacterised protein [Mycobacteroides abscessus subsp. abscessus]|nr:Uncharacterised protein [Mycobacteroides abscessus subsp. abscessus]